MALLCTLPLFSCIQLARNSTANSKMALPDTPLLRTPLFDTHLALKSRMVPFSGWEMPVQYSGITQEHQAVRQQAGMFDISHMGKFQLRGRQVLQHLQQLVPTDLSRLQPQQAQYTVLLNPQGGIIDDLIFYYQGEDQAGEQQVVAIVNAATAAKDKAWMLEQLDPQVTLEDRSAELVLLAVQGPEAIQRLQPFVEIDLSRVPRFGHVVAPLFGQASFLARTGYTGEDGFEVMLPPEAGIQLWQALQESGVVPCGLGCRDTLRLEAAMALYGQDIDETTSPLEAGLGWLVHLDRVKDFIGRAVLEQQKQTGVLRRLVGLQLSGRNIARHDYPVLADIEIATKIGTVTSGTLSPTLGYPIALAYVPTAYGKLGQSLAVEIRNKAYPAIVVKRPFYKSQMI